MNPYLPRYYLKARSLVNELRGVVDELRREEARLGFWDYPLYVSNNARFNARRKRVLNEHERLEALLASAESYYSDFSHSEGPMPPNTYVSNESWEFKVLRAFKRYRSLQKEYYSLLGEVQGLYDKYREELSMMVFKNYVPGSRNKRLVLKPERDIPDKRFHYREATMWACRDLAKNTRSRKGNAWEGVAAHNAGLAAVKRFNGIPFYKETVTFVNRVAAFHRRNFSRTVRGRV